MSHSLPWTTLKNKFSGFILCVFFKLDVSYHSAQEISLDFMLRAPAFLASGASHLLMACISSHHHSLDFLLLDCELLVGKTKVLLTEIDPGPSAVPSWMTSVCGYELSYWNFQWIKNRHNSLARSKAFNQCFFTWSWWAKSTEAQLFGPRVWDSESDNPRIKSQFCLLLFACPGPLLSKGTTSQDCHEMAWNHTCEIYISDCWCLLNSLWGQRLF